MNNQLSRDAIKDSLIAYVPFIEDIDTNRVRRVSHFHTIGFQLAVNMEKVLPFFSEIGISVGALRFSKGVTMDNHGNTTIDRRLRFTAVGSFVYTFLGYGFNLKLLRITPNLRYTFGFSHVNARIKH